MKFLKILPFILFTISCFAFQKSDKMIQVTVHTNAKQSKISTKYSVVKWSKDASIFSISITNDGDSIELIKDVSIQILNSPAVTADSRVLFGSSQMGNAPLVEQGLSENKNSTETVLMIKNGNNSFFKTGILTWEIFRPAISFTAKTGIVIFADGENKPVKPGQTISFEKIVIESGTNWQDMLYDYGKQIAKVQNIKPKKMNQFKGWSTWDYYGQIFTEKEIKLNIDKLKSDNKNANIIQIDGGWWKRRGDYTNYRNDIQGGMKGIAQMIKENGYVAGLHLDGFKAEEASEVYKAHPDFFLKNEKGEVFYQEWPRPDRTERSIYFDYSNPAAREYIKNVLKTLREEWGFQYFKIDFMVHGLNAEIQKSQKKYGGVKEIKAFDPSMTSMERTRAGLKAMREGMGDAFFVGCSSVFGSTFGIVDGLRTGGDIFPNYESYKGRCIQNGGNFYLHQTVVQTDADYLVVRNKDDEEAERAWKGKFGGTVTLNEAAMWADYVTLFGGSKFSSDNLNILRPERKALVKNTFSINSCNRFIPIDFWDKAKSKDDAFNIMLGVNDEGVYLALFNWNDSDLGITLSNVPTTAIELVNSIEKPNYKANKNGLEVKLKSRTSVIFKLKNGTDFDKVRNQMRYEFHK